MNPFVATMSLLALALAGSGQTLTNQPTNGPANDTASLGSLTAEEAKQALEGIRSAERQPGLGTWRKITFTPGKTNVLYEWRPSENSVLRREEIVTLSPTNSSQLEHLVSLDNLEGSWTLFGNYAYRRDRPLGGSNGAEQWPGDKESVETLNQAMQMDLQDAKLARVATVTGERMKQGSAVRLRLVETYGDQAQMRVADLITGPLTASLNKLKKEVPLPFRSLVKPSMLTAELMKGMPVRKELLIDETTGNILERRLYLPNGLLLRGEVLWASCADLQESDYALPAGMKQMGLPVIADAPAETNKAGVPIENEHSIILKRDEVLAISAPSGPTALLQFTDMSTNVATYRWRCRPSKAAPFETGTGRVTRVAITVPDSAGTPKRIWHIQATIRLSVRA